MINLTGGEATGLSNIISFPLWKATQRKPQADQKEIGRKPCRVLPIHEGCSVGSISESSGLKATGCDAAERTKPGATIKAARVFRVLPTSEAGRAFLRPRYVKHITQAIRDRNIMRLHALYQKESFTLMPAADKLSIAKAVIAEIKGLRLNSELTAGLSGCFLEAFKQGLGTRSDFRQWMTFTVNKLSLDVLEHLVVAADVNHEIRTEATALVFECYS